MIFHLFREHKFELILNQKLADFGVETTFTLFTLVSWFLSLSNPDAKIFTGFLLIELENNGVRLLRMRITQKPALPLCVE